jgi:predicted alpha/beta-fold hydrolase
VKRSSDDGEYRYRAAWWLPGPHAQTIWGRIVRRRELGASVECVQMPDGDNVELHHLDAPSGSPHLLLLHGLEGSVRSHYVHDIMRGAARRQWAATLLVFRGCGAAANTARRFYHSGETTDLAHVFQALAARDPASTWLLAGVSLGGNVLLKYLGELGEKVDPRIRAAAAVSVPFDLEAGARKISTGFSRIYDRSFLRTLRRKAVAKLLRYPDLFDKARLDTARSIYDFDETVTAPVHGFASAHDYYQRSSSRHFLRGIRVRTLLLSAYDDPFLPKQVLQDVLAVARQNPNIEVEVHRHGGHVGFVSGSPWKPEYYAERRILQFFDRMLEARA